MRCAFVALLGVVALSVTGCQKEEVTAYRVPKEKESEPKVAAVAAGKMPDDAAHAGVKPGTAPASAPSTTSAPVAPAAGPAPSGTSMASTPVATATGSGLAWKGPGGHWQEKGASGMRKGTFTIAGDGGAAAELAITAFPGDVGGEVANVNRWRGQVQLPPQSEADVAAAIQRLESNGLKIGVVEMAGKDPSGKDTRVIGAMVPHSGSTWFFKLSGPDALVAKEKAAFMEFVKTIKAG
ncbi:MAG: hypothetical protein V4773_19080 [Verrucomicrobiota bacterium]